MSDSFELVGHLKNLSANLWWSWHPEIWEIFETLDAERWSRLHQNPIAFIESFEPGELEARAGRGALASRIQQAARRQADELRERGPSTLMEAAPLHRRPVAYFCAEFGLHESLPIYSGGLGVLAGDHLKAASDLGVPIVGVGLFYAEGYFQQALDEEGRQSELYGRTRVDTLPIRKLLDADGQPRVVQVEVAGRPIRLHVWEAHVGRTRLLLLDCDIDLNPPDDRRLTTQLYGGDQRTRIRQEVLLGVGGVRALAQLGISPGVFHLNEGHSAFATLELCARRMAEEGIDWEEARQRVARQTVFTTHTPVPAGHDRFAPEMIDEALGDLRERLNLDLRAFHGLGRLDLDDPNEPFCMTVLAMKMSQFTNGVSNLHGRVSRQMWQNLWPQRPAHEVPIGHITNGIHVASFLAPQMRALFDRHLGPDWHKRMERPETWQEIAAMDDGELWETHQILKAKLLDFVQTRLASQPGPRGDGPGQVRPGSGLDQDVLTIGFARRFATYKRADLILSDLERFKAMIHSSERPIQIIYAGKAHPADRFGKALIEKIVGLTTDPALGGRVVFLADYDMNIARHLVQGVDLWLNNPRRPQEACGTSGQKAVFNGALGCSILDGWWAEGFDGENGFAIGQGAELPDPEAQDALDAQELYRVLEDEVLPLYYELDHRGLRAGWIARMKWAMLSLGWRYNARRMVLDYLRLAYLPALGATSASSPNQ
ncbi:glycosyltransferase family 1 protein [Lujinxingia vulgaris]|uniref:Glycosyltransferase family 1 protein n=1 Tax=Lujinxingia vulgaris TaxID=2600176 RepID=A0A5C6XD20_9DELT|nr:alpha-glucan family phosphorylase [Lujinxingia vulgaris]TXD36679.1 glycosyltransferase family 1 protein [Lujinxingia vulgaris]